MTAEQMKQEIIRIVEEEFREDRLEYLFTLLKDLSRQQDPPVTACPR